MVRCERRVGDPFVPQADQRGRVLGGTGIMLLQGLLTRAAQSIYTTAVASAMIVVALSARGNTRASVRRTASDI
jgi:hypothetical protein